MSRALRMAIVSAALAVALASCGEDRRPTTDRPATASPSAEPVAAGRILDADARSFGGERRGPLVVGAHPRARWEQELDLDAVATSTPWLNAR